MLLYYRIRICKILYFPNFSCWQRCSQIKLFDSLELILINIYSWMNSKLNKRKWLHLVSTNQSRTEHKRNSLQQNRKDVVLSLSVHIVLFFCDCVTFSHETSDSINTIGCYDNRQLMPKRRRKKEHWTPFIEKIKRKIGMNSNEHRNSSHDVFSVHIRFSKTLLQLNRFIVSYFFLLRFCYQFSSEYFSLVLPPCRGTLLMHRYDFVFLFFFFFLLN